MLRDISLKDSFEEYGLRCFFFSTVGVDETTFPLFGLSAAISGLSSDI